MAARSSLVLLAAFFAACTGDTPKVKPPVDAGSVIGRSCSVDAECSPLPCDPVLLICICQKDSDCPGEYCDNFTGKCVASVPGCTKDADCTNGGFCNPDTRACEALKGFCEECNPLVTPSDPACGSGNACHADTSLNESFCARSCMGNGDCPQGATCQDINMNGMPQCWPAPGTNCKTFTGCVPDSNISCDNNNDCIVDGGPPNQMCDGNSGTCVAEEKVCPLGTTCDPVNLVCVLSCTVDADCVAPNACVNNICQPLPSCQSDVQCPDNKVCAIGVSDAQGKCVPFCMTDMDCPSAQVCVAQPEADGSTRFKCINSCLSTNECPLNQVCIDNSGNLLRGGNDGGDYGTCQPTLNSQTSCQFTSACNSCQFCGYDNTCQSGASIAYCSPCDTSITDDCQLHQGAPAGSQCLVLVGLDSNGDIIGTGATYCGIACESNLAATYADGGQAALDGADCPAGFVCAQLENGLGFNCVPTNFDCQGSGPNGTICQ